RLRDAAGAFRRDLGVVHTDAAGRFTVTVPASATTGYRPSAPIGPPETLGIDAVGFTGSGGSAAADGSVAVPVASHAKGLALRNSFVSSVGWVNPGQTYPFLVRVLNASATRYRHATVTLHGVSGMTIRSAHVLHGNRLRVRHGGITWRVGSLPAGTRAKPTTRTLVVSARSKSLHQDPRVVWKNLSTTARLRYAKHTRTATSHGPRVVPAEDTFSTARYGDRPFPVVPVDYADFQHTANHPAVKLDRVINGRTNR